MSQKRMGITDVLQSVKENASGEKVELGEVVEHLENRGFGPILLAPALVALFPTGAIPGIPSACGILIFLIAIQMVWGKKHPWLPQKLKSIGFSQDKLAQVIDKSSPYTQKVDRWFKPRVSVLSQGVVKRLVALLCALAGLIMIPLELVPFAVMLPAFAIVLAAVGLSTEDGVVITLASLIMMGSFYLLWVNYIQ
ncbi:exopolysaccharide biosynthesis protein [Kangiella marina]|uniref:Exopolysaccharide biosynthesis protein exod n=1 Tax=Kangiella marina TaxID=1079178 RepID=A0ABP8ID16_9GAMM